MSKIYIVVETSWDHHENKGVFDTHKQASNYQEHLEETRTGYHYDIEEYELNALS